MVIIDQQVSSRLSVPRIPSSANANPTAPFQSLQRPSPLVDRGDVRRGCEGCAREPTITLVSSASYSEQPKRRPRSSSRAPLVPLRPPESLHFFLPGGRSSAQTRPLSFLSRLKSLLDTTTSRLKNVQPRAVKSYSSQPAGQDIL
jgi:hypothetical protein